LPPSSWRASSAPRFDASTAAPRPHDFAVRTGSFVRMEDHAATRRAHRIPRSTSVTIAIRPLQRGGMAASKSRFSEIGKRNVGRRGWTRDHANRPGQPLGYRIDDRSFALACLHVVMAGLVPAIHVVRHAGNDVDARDEPGHDGVTNGWGRSLRQPCISICDWSAVSPSGDRARRRNDQSRGGRSSISCSPRRIAVGRSCATRSEIHRTSAGSASSFACRRSGGKSRSCAVPTLMLRRS